MRRHPPAALAVLTLLAATAPLAAQQPRQSAGDRPEFIGANPAWPFSQAVRVGNLIYLSGMIADSADTVVKGGIQAETRRIMENMKSFLDGAGSSMDDVVKCTVFLADIKEWAAMNEVYVTFFPRNRPARSALGTSGLARNARVEIECIAAAGPARS
jgi:reactive intermediate/imine deaminase